MGVGVLGTVAASRPSKYKVIRGGNNRTAGEVPAPGSIPSIP